MVSRGVSSATFLHMAVEAANDAYDRHGVTSVVVLLFDYDAGSARAATSIRRTLRGARRSADRVPAHRRSRRGRIEEWNLPTRPAKRSDPQAASWGPIAVELDAIPPNQLRALVEAEITNRIEPHAWNLARRSRSRRARAPPIASPQEASTRDRAASDRGRGGRPARGPGVVGRTPTTRSPTGSRSPVAPG